MEQFLIRVIRLLLPLFFIVCLSPTHMIAISKNNTDYESLVSFKHQLLKQQSSAAASSLFMSSWNETNNKRFCSWEGVFCGRKHPDRVTGLDLSSNGFAGLLPPSIFNLTFLKILDLSNNSLNDEISPNFSRLQRLQYLNLSFNSFHGDIPDTLMTNSSTIQVMDLSYNQLTGKIPFIICTISQLRFLRLDTNHIIGTIPPSLGNFSSLESLYVHGNHLEGSIPPEIGVLRKLIYFQVGENNLSGNIPSSFYNISSLRRISLADNQISGEIPVDISKAFPNLEYFLIDSNHFTGSLCQAFQNITSLIELDLGGNNFIGVVPPNLGRMHNLTFLSLASNELEARDAREWRFFDSLINCTKLELLGFDRNNFGGMLPNSIRNLSTELQFLILAVNHISGNIPSEIGRYTNLIEISMAENLFEGPIPESIGKLRRLQYLSFEENNLTGIIPNTLGNLTGLEQLWLGSNLLTGPIPSSLQKLQFLNSLDLRNNKLTGLIPSGLFLIPSLSNILDFSNNFFTGALPSEVGRLINIFELDFSNNKLIEEIPESLGSCQVLVELYMKYNFFHGSIPASLGKLKSLKMLDLSHNNLSGTIPQSLQNLSLLKYLNLSFNNLEGEVPSEGVFTNSTAISLIGNKNICGGILNLHLPKCVIRSSSTKNIHHFIKVLAPVLSMLVVLLVLLLSCIFFYRLRKKSGQRRNSSDLSLSTPFPRISYMKLAKATNDFSTSHLVGYGRYGSVYRGTLRGYQNNIAIKVFKLEVHGALKSFTSECDALRSIRHRNLVKVLTSCSSIDTKGKDFKALIFEFMPKGNLDMWLHQEYETDGDSIFALERRLNIIIDVADALEYLHHSCEPSIIHCDIKPSNILLDDDMIAHVGDFGLSRIISDAISMPLQDYSDKIEIKGTIGYLAPEYGRGARASTSADVYSFGIILLEMLTGRRPTDDIFNDNLNLYNYVKKEFSHGINSIIDLKMFAKEQREADYSNCQRINKCLISLAEVGLSCSTSFPDERPNMIDVAAKLHTIKVSHLHGD